MLTLLHHIGILVILVLISLYATIWVVISDHSNKWFPVPDEEMNPFIAFPLLAIGLGYIPFEIFYWVVYLFFLL